MANIDNMARDIVAATSLFKDFFGRNPEMTDISDVKELLAIGLDVNYARQRLEER